MLWFNFILGSIFISLCLKLIIIYYHAQKQRKIKIKLRIKLNHNIYSKRPFPSSPGPLFQNEGRCSAFDMEIIFHSHANKTHFYKKGCAPSLILKVRVFGTRKWPIELWQPVCHTGKARGSAKVFLCTLFFRFVLFLFCFLHTSHVC